MQLVIFWAIIFSISTAASITILGQRELISGNMLEWKKIILLIINWKFIASMIFALVARMSFIMINNSLLKIPRLADSSTTITAFITILSFVFIIASNYIFLKEKINIEQGLGAIIIIFGVFILLK